MTMKKIFVAVLSFLALTASAQLELKKLDGTPINNGDVFTFTETTEPAAYLGLKIFNTSDEDIYIRARVVSITNSVGNNLQLCVGDVCLNSISAGSTYPNFPAMIPANGQNGNFDHFVNYNGGIDPTQPVEYTLRILMVNESGQEIPGGGSVQFTYRYVSPLSTDSFSLSSVGVALQSTYVGEQLVMTADLDTVVKIFDVNGKLTATEKVVAGDRTMDVSSLASGVYIVNFTNNAGRSASARIVKK